MKNRLDWIPPLFFCLAVLGLLGSVYSFFQAKQLSQIQSDQTLLVSDQQRLSALLQSRVAANEGHADLLTEFDSSLQQLSATLATNSNEQDVYERVDLAHGNLLAGLQVSELEQSQTQKNQLRASLEQLNQSTQNTATVKAEKITTVSAATSIVGNSSAGDLSTLIETSSELRRSLGQIDAPAMQIESAGHLYQLAVSVDKKFIVEPDGNIVIDKARGPWLVFDQILKRMEAMLGTGEIADQTVVSLITALRAEQVKQAQVFDGSISNLSQVATPDSAVEIQPAVVPIAPTVSAQQSLRREFLVLDGALSSMRTAVSGLADRAQTWFSLGLMSAAVSAGIILLLGLGMLRARAERREYEQSVQSDQQASILKLLNEISSLAEGDLNTRATVTEGMTGAIADSVNYAVAELRRLVGSMTTSAERVTVAVEDTGATAQQLASASAMQSREISRSSSYLKAMADTMAQMSKRSIEASSIGNRSVRLSTSGKEAVDRTVLGMQTIASRTTKTTRLLKRLGDSSQQIGRTVTLMDEVADKTRLLAMNAAIQARGQGSDSGTIASASRVADQVNSLSATLGHSAAEIRSLVTTMQQDVALSIKSMDRTHQEVQGVSALSEHAGTCLNEIEEVSKRLAVVVDHLNSRTQRQTDVVSQLSANMGVINDVTRNSAHGLRLSASALEDLRLMSTELRDSVSEFSLPASDREAIARRTARIRAHVPEGSDVASDSLNPTDIAAEYGLDQTIVDAKPPGHTQASHLQDRSQSMSKSKSISDLHDETRVDSQNAMDHDQTLAISPDRYDEATVVLKERPAEQPEQFSSKDSVGSRGDAKSSAERSES